MHFIPRAHGWLDWHQWSIRLLITFAAPLTAALSRWERWGKWRITDCFSPDPGTYAL